MASVVLLRAVSAITRAMLLALASFGLVARVAIVLAALAASRGNAAGATTYTLVASAAWLLHRLLGTHTRVSVECELYRVISRRLLDTDVLEVPAFDLQRAVFEGAHHARAYLTQSLPALFADAVAAFVVVPIVLTELPARVVGLAVGVLALAVVSLVLVRLATRGLHERVTAASDRVYGDVLRALEGRLEIVARGGEEAHAAQLDARLDDYARLARRANLRAAALGRIPIALAVAAVVGAAIADSAMRESLASTVVARALVLGASAPFILGIVVGVVDLARATAQVKPLVALLTTTARDDLTRRGGASVALPGPVEGRALAFRYGRESPTILDGVTFAWKTRAPLVVAGPNGAGKSTLLKLLIGLRPPTRGVISVGEHDLSSSDVIAMRRDVAYLPQRPYLGEAYTTLREVLASVRAATSDDVMRDALERVGLEERSLDGALGELSAGQRQRLALARILVQDATLILLDEPDANLDREGIELVRDLVIALCGDGKMVAVAAHTKELSDIEAVRITLER